jgi:hypothetical protein
MVWFFPLSIDRCVVGPSSSYAIILLPLVSWYLQTFLIMVISDVYYKNQFDYYKVSILTVTCLTVAANLWHRWQRIYSVCLLSSTINYHRIFNRSNTTGSTPFFSGVCVTHIFSFLDYILHKTNDRVKRTPLKTGRELGSSETVRSFCITSGTRSLHLATDLVISHEWGNYSMREY